MSFKILANIDNKIQYFSIPFMINRNGHIEDKVNNLYFDEINPSAKENKSLYINYIKTFSKNDEDVEQFKKYENFLEEHKSTEKSNFIGSSLFLTHYLNYEQQKVVSNMMYNTIINAYNDWILNLFMIVGKLPNLEDESSAFIIKFSDLKMFFDKMEEINQIDDFIFKKRHKSNFELLNEYYKEGKITDDIIITHEFYFPDEIEMTCGYGEPDEVLLSLEFQKYLKDNKGAFNGLDYNEIVESYLEEQDVTMDNNLLMDGYKSYIKTNSYNRVYIDIEECKELDFIHSEIIEKLKK